MNMFFGTTEEEVLAKAKADGWQDEFEGQNCNDYGDCDGWDGESRRCDCGNRRVYWATLEISDGKWQCWAEAW